MRDNFSAGTKKKLAERVAYRCCFPSCNAVTIGPNSTTDELTVNLGHAAHIHAASKGGPRYKPDMTREERCAINNGIWLCANHAKLIDADNGQFSANTLMQWKKTAEAETYLQLGSFEKKVVDIPTTLVCLDINLVFEATWTAITENTWTFTVKKFVLGDEQQLRAFETKDTSPMLNYVIVESQGDGRLIKTFHSHINNRNEPEITVEILPKMPRIPLSELQEDEVRDKNGRPVLINGQPQKISGELLAKQIIELNLNLPFAGWPQNVLLGSFFSMYYQRLGNNLVLLNRITKIELTRLINIPTYQMDTTAQQPELNFINRILEVKVSPDINGVVPLFLSLEWGDRSVWSGDLKIQLYYRNDQYASYAVPDDVKDIFDEPPLQKLKSRFAAINKEVIQRKVNNDDRLYLCCEILPRILAEAMPILESDVFPYFIDHHVYKIIDRQTISDGVEIDVPRMINQGRLDEMGICVKLEGFIKGGYDSFSTHEYLHIFVKDYAFEIGTSRENIWFRRYYHKPLEEEDILAISGHWTRHIGKEVLKKVEWFCKAD